MDQGVRTRRANRASPVVRELLTQVNDLGYSRIRARRVRPALVTMAPLGPTSGVLGARASRPLRVPRARATAEAAAAGLAVQVVAGAAVRSAGAAAAGPGPAHASGR
jgi:hypothetical protein